jgi:hypothetical protein
MGRRGGCFRRSSRRWKKRKRRRLTLYAEGAECRRMTEPEQALLGDQPIVAHRDPEADGGDSFQGVATLDLGETTRAAQAQPKQRGKCVVAGGCYDTVCTLPVPLELPVAGWVAARAA